MCYKNKKTSQNVMYKSNISKIGNDEPPKKAPEARIILNGTGWTSNTQWWNASTSE